MKKNGFTLVELMVVIAIIAILAVGSITGYNSYLEKAEDNTKVQQYIQIATAIRSNAYTTGTLPTARDTDGSYTTNGTTDIITRRVPPAMTSGERWFCLGEGYTVCGAGSGHAHNASLDADLNNIMGGDVPIMSSGGSYHGAVYACERQANGICTVMLMATSFETESARDKLNEAGFCLSFNAGGASHPWKFHCRECFDHKGNMGCSNLDA